MKNLREVVRDAFHHGESQTPENRHLDINWQRRMDRAQQEAERLLPEGCDEVKKIREHLHSCRKLMTHGLEGKE